MADESRTPPKRVQRKRLKGWKMPANTVYVGRPTQWGNPFRPSPDARTDAEKQFTKERAVKAYRFEIVQMNGGIVGFNRFWVRAKLRGRNLACFCPLDQPCHADVLLELANAD